MPLEVALNEVCQAALGGVFSPESAWNALGPMLRAAAQRAKETGHWGGMNGTRKLWEKMSGQRLPRQGLVSAKSAAPQDEAGWRMDEMKKAAVRLYLLAADGQSGRNLALNMICGMYQQNMLDEKFVTDVFGAELIEEALYMEYRPSAWSRCYPALARTLRDLEIPED